MQLDMLQQKKKKKKAKVNVTQHFITVSQLQYTALPDWKINVESTVTNSSTPR